MDNVETNRMKIRTLLLSSPDGVVAHPYGETTPLLRSILEPKTELVVDLDLERVKSEGGLADFQALVLHGQYPPDDAAERALEAFVESGRGLVIVHIASSSFQGSPRFRRLAGRVWEYGDNDHGRFTSNHPPVGAFQVDIADPIHPITVGMRPFVVVQDERYQDLLVAPDVTCHDLATATLDGRTEPIAWVVLPPRGGRVFHITLGHNRATYTNSAFIDFIHQGLDWAAAAGAAAPPSRHTH